MGQRDHGDPRDDVDAEVTPDYSTIHIFIKLSTYYRSTMYYDCIDNPLYRWCSRWVEEEQRC